MKIKKQSLTSLIGVPVINGTSGSILFIDANGKLGQDNSNLFWDDANNRLGIGTNSPDSVFHIKANFPGIVGSDYAGQLIIQDPDDTVFGNAVITGYESDGAGNPDQQLWYLGSSSINDSNIIFLNRRNSKLQLGTNGVSRLTILGNGNIGIGTTSPSAKLTVAGDSGNLLQIENTSETVLAKISSIGRLSVGGGTHTGHMPELGFVDSDTGFWEDGSDRLYVSINNNSRWLWDGVTFKSNGGGPALTLRSLSNTLVTIAPQTGDANTGFNSPAADELSIITGGTEAIRIDDSQNIGVGTATPTIPLDVKAKSGMTAIGGFAIKLTNTTGVVTVAGQLVKADTATNDAVILTEADEDECFGVFLESGIADDAEAWVVVSGIADVAMEDNTTATRGNWVRTSITEAGYADATNNDAPQPINQTHFAEVGHCIETVTATGGGTHILARCVLHFN